jgi:hypothetical protein
LILHIGDLVPVDLVCVQVNQPLRVLVISSIVAAHEELSGGYVNHTPIQYFGQAWILRSSELPDQLNFAVGRLQLA